MSMDPSCRHPRLAVIIVTHNNGVTIEATLRCVANQSEPAEQVVVVDAHSADTAWVSSWSGCPGIEIVALERNPGFTGANNLGWRRLSREVEFVLFLNPDVHLPSGLFAQLRRVCAESRFAGYGVLSLRLVRWDFAVGRATGEIDSTGIFPRRLGGWYDRRSLHPKSGDYVEEVPAVCGAFFLARVEALRSVQFEDGTVWDDRYFAYKEDIELSLRLRRAGWRVGIWHGGEAGHGRGWKSRRTMPRQARLLSARNELRLCWDYDRRRAPFAAVKWMAVALLDL